MNYFQAPILKIGRPDPEPNSNDLLRMHALLKIVYTYFTTGTKRRNKDKQIYSKYSTNSFIEFEIFFNSEVKRFQIWFH